MQIDFCKPHARTHHDLSGNASGPRKTRRIACSTQCTLLFSHNRPTIYSGRSVWLTNHRKGFRASPGWAGTIAQARGPAGHALPVPRQGGLPPQIADHTYMGQYGSMLSEEDLQIAACTIYSLQRPNTLISQRVLAAMHPNG